MKKTTNVLLVIVLLLAMAGSTIIVPVMAYIRHNPHTIPSGYPYNTLANAINIGNPAPGDMIFINGGYAEILAANLIISTNYLWIVGAPAAIGGPPTIDFSGFSIQFTGIGQFLIGLNLVDTVVTTSPAIVIGTQLTGLPGDACSIWNNSVTGPGSTYSGTVGIQVFSDANAIANNTVSGWDIGVDLNGLYCFNNYVRANTLGQCGTVALKAEQSAMKNVVCHNNLDYGSSGTVYFLDTSITTNANYFDDTTGYPLYGYGPYNEGNYYKGGVPTPYPIGSDADNYPLPNPYSPIKADFDRDGQVSLSDLVILSNSYGSTFGSCSPPNHGWDPRTDVAPPWNMVGLSDLVTLARVYGQHDP